jgi:hypothetical protein
MFTHVWTLLTVPVWSCRWTRSHGRPHHRRRLMRTLSPRPHSPSQAGKLGSRRHRSDAQGTYGITTGPLHALLGLDCDLFSAFGNMRQREMSANVWHVWENEGLSGCHGTHARTSEAHNGNIWAGGSLAIAASARSVPCLFGTRRGTDGGLSPELEGDHYGMRSSRIVPRAKSFASRPTAPFLTCPKFHGNKTFKPSVTVHAHAHTHAK